MAVAFIETPPDESITLDTSNGPVCYKIAGIIYFGNNHFTARYIDHDNVVWFNDGMIQGRRAAREGLLEHINMMNDPNGKVPDAFVYRRCT
ncbi:hypothetical protein ARMGADRAFT_911557 [Armillaria gallica]|uniref:Uncharacterized protein n=1 Tax=Armillaria gallica TaxID=47427 RepID=A0A2H3EN66_ARMGA|nr:hypothetical protein ARMGADRAFT_911557 [Armillaria gallica]